MQRFLPLAFLMIVASCDSGAPGGPDPTDPAGDFAIDPIWFEHNLLAEPSVNGWENLQAWIEGSLKLAASEGTLSGTGRCTVRRRRHRAWLGQTSDESETLPVTASGSLEGEAVVLTIQGCAWAMARYTGTFSGGRYTLRLGELRTAPAWTPDVWDEALFVEGDDPRDLLLTRK